MIFCKNVKPHLIYAVDIQEEAIELLRMSVEKNHLENTLQPVLADLRELNQTQIGFETMGYRHRKSPVHDQRLRL